MWVLTSVGEKFDANGMNPSVATDG